MPSGTDRSSQVGRRLKLRELEVFIAVVRRGSMARAATDLGITQPSVSEIITNLEHATGMQLLERGPRGVTPTIYGGDLLRGGTAAIDDLQQSIKEMQFRADPWVGDVHVGCPETVATLLPPIIKRLSRKHPRILVHVSDVVAPTLDLPQLRDRSLDQRWFDTAALRASIPSRTISASRCCLMMSWSLSRAPRAVGRAIARSISQSLPKPAGYCLLSRHQIAGRCLRLSASVVVSVPKVMLVTFSQHLRMSMLADANTVTVLPRSVLNFGSNRSAVKALPIKLPRHDFPLAIVTLKGRVPNPAVQLFIADVREGLRSGAASFRGIP